MKKLVLCAVLGFGLLLVYLWLKPYRTAEGHMPATEAELAEIMGFAVPFEFEGSLAAFRLPGHGDEGYVVRKTRGGIQIQSAAICHKVEQDAIKLGYGKSVEKVEANKSYLVGATCWFVKETKRGTQLIAISEDAFVYAFEN